jgi:hypothetical protein
VINSQVNQNAKRALCEFEAKSACDVKLKTIDEHNAAFRWLLGSLFALNGGAAISLMGSKIVTVQVIFEAEKAFLSGVLSCFVMAILGQISDRKMIAKMHAWGLYWTKVSVTLEQDPEEEVQIRNAIAEAERTGRHARMAGIVSMASFLVGCILIGASLAR